jgi:hypothetical protein
VNIGIGYTINLFANILVFPLFGYNISLADNIVIGLVFTIISVCRQYVVRRYFNKGD